MNDPVAAAEPAIRARVNRIIAGLRSDAPIVANSTSIEPAELLRRLDYWRDFAADPNLAGHEAIQARTAEVISRLQIRLEGGDPPAIIPPPRPESLQQSSGAARVAHWKEFLADIGPNAPPSLTARIQEIFDALHVRYPELSESPDGATALRHGLWLLDRLSDARVQYELLAAEEPNDEDEDVEDEEKEEDDEQPSPLRRAQRQITRLHMTLQQTVQRLDAAAVPPELPEGHNLGPCANWMQADEYMALGLVTDLAEHGLIPTAGANRLPDPNQWHIQFAEPPYYPNLLFVHLQARSADGGPGLAFAMHEADKSPTPLEGGIEVAYRLNTETDFNLTEETAPFYAAMILDLALRRKLSPGDDRKAPPSRDAYTSDAGFHVGCTLAGRSGSFPTKLLVTKHAGQLILSSRAPEKES